MPILVGGSGLYVSSVIYDFQFPGTDAAIRARLDLEVGDAGLIARVEHVEHVVRDATPLLHRELGGADVHAPVELHRVGVDYLGALSLGFESLSERQ